MLFAVDVGGAASRDLERLYLWCEDCCARATNERDAKHLHEARKVLATLLDGWRQIELQSNAGSRAS